MVAISFIAACGGDGESGGYEYFYTYYGSIAINQNTGAAGIASNYESKKSANDAAVEQCGNGCVVALEIGAGLCGALARSSTGPTFGWASDKKLSNAKSNAIGNCTNNNGVSCSVVLDACND